MNDVERLTTVLAMAIIRMVRHGEASAGYNVHPDPGLSPTGHRQAGRVADALGSLRAQTVISSPMTRARETANPLAKQWGVSVATEPAVSEIPSPGLSPEARGPWLQGIMAGTWDDASDQVRAWRDGIAAYLLSLDIDAVVFSHFVAINAALSVATDSEQPRVAHLDHCSVTTFETSHSQLRVVETGEQAQTTVL